MPSAQGCGVNPASGLPGAAGLPEALLQSVSEGFAERGGRSRLGDSLACSFPSKCFKRQRLEIKKELLCGVLRRLCKFLHLGSVCLSLLPLDSPKQLVASCGGELSHASNALAPKGCLGNVSLCLEGVSGTPYYAYGTRATCSHEPRSNPRVAGLMAQTRRRTCWAPISQRQLQQGCCSSARARGDLRCGDDLARAEAISWLQLLKLWALCL